MPPIHRSAGRNIHIYDVNDPATVLGGLTLTNGVTNANFYAMVDIICIFDDHYILLDERDSTIYRDDHPLQQGKYYIVTAGSITVNDEPWLVRALSVGTGTRMAAFSDAIRKRDGRCIVTGEVAVAGRHGNWTGFEAAHIFPLAYERHWQNYNYGRWMTIPAATGSSIDSMQNGMLLRSDIHQLFDAYDFSINPDDNHKIVCFDIDGKGIAGKHLAQQFLDDPQRPPDSLLRWHFRQAVLANVKGLGEPIFEFDFPPGSDIMGQIASGPRAGERMEFEMYSRLAVR